MTAYFQGKPIFEKRRRCPITIVYHFGDLYKYGHVCQAKGELGHAPVPIQSLKQTNKQACTCVGQDILETIQKFKRPQSSYVDPFHAGFYVNYYYN